MPKVKDDRPASDQVAWVKYLPKEGGGEWGQGVTRTVASTEEEVKQVQVRLDAMRAKHSREESELVQLIRSREKLLSETVRRAGVEVSMLYADAQIDHARAQADNAAKRAMAAAEASSSGGASADAE